MKMLNIPYNNYKT